jgi:hypothetical protein
MAKLLINKTNTRKYILMVANEHANNITIPDTQVDSSGKQWDYSCLTKHPLKKYTQVCPTLIEDLDRVLRKTIYEHVDKMKRGGKTVR